MLFPRRTAVAACRPVKPSRLDMIWITDRHRRSRYSPHQIAWSTWAFVQSGLFDTPSTTLTLYEKPGVAGSRGVRATMEESTLYSRRR